MRFSTVLVILLLIGSFLIISSYHLDIGKGEDRISFAKLFGKWIVHAGKNTVNLMGMAIHMEWFPPTNASNSTITNGSSTNP